MWKFFSLCLGFKLEILFSIDEPIRYYYELCYMEGNILLNACKFNHLHKNLREPMIIEENSNSIE